jgi:hypothetical protein
MIPTLIVQKLLDGTARQRHENAYTSALQARDKNFHRIYLTRIPFPISYVPLDSIVISPHTETVLTE